MRLAFFVSPHGFGHAARSAAVMEAIWRRVPETRFEIFTTVPRWFFEDSLSCCWRYHDLECDIGLVQRSALDEDVMATYERLKKICPFSEDEVQRLADILVNTGCDGVVCDISPLGLSAAKAAGLPSCLVENFTWDWVYRFYVDVCPGLGPIADYFEEIFDGADFRLQTIPYCERLSKARQVAPVSRSPRTSRLATRMNLGLEDHKKLVLVSMGGIPWDFSGLDRVAAAQGVMVVVPGGSTAERRFGSVVSVPHRSRFFHPDLMHAADGLIGKVGYSTVAEAWAAGLGMGWIRRPDFPESEVLVRWVEKELGGEEISCSELVDGSWADHIEAVLAVRPKEPDRPNGADQAAELMLDFLNPEWGSPLV